MKTGECYYRDENGSLWLAESYCDNDGTVWTTVTLIEHAESAPAPAEG